MNKKRILALGVVTVLLGLLIYLQVRTWKNFDWAVFWSRTDHVSLLGLLGGVVLTYLAYVLRAVRWRIFLKPVCETTTARLVGPQFVGFTALALLGRAGEMVRPYIIAKKERLTFTSQIAVWGVERIFDMGAFGVLLIISLFSPDVQALPFYHHWITVHGIRLDLGLRDAAFVLMALVGSLIVGAVVVGRWGERVGQFFYGLFAGFAPKVAHHLREKIHSFSEGLKTIHDFSSAMQLVAVSLVMWVLTSGSYYCITHAYPGELRNLTVPDQVVLMGSAMVGSMLQLPAVGGGTQLATISMLHSGFGVEKELAVSCGILIWAISFMSVIPVGLALARREHLSLRAVAEAEQKAEAALAE